MNPAIDQALDQLRGQLSLLHAAVSALEQLRQASPFAHYDSPKAQPLEPHPAPKSLPTKPKPPRKPSTKPATPGKTLTVVNAAREFFADNAGRSFTTEQIREYLTQAHPEIADKIKSASVHLIDMANRAELLRDGTGRDATYKAGPRLAPPGSSSIGPLSNRETAYREFRATVAAPTPSPLE